MSTKSEYKRRKYGRPILRRDPDPFFKRTEGNVLYEYNKYIAYIFQRWSSATRDNGQVPKFADFFEQLLPQDKATVKVEIINQTN